MIIWDWLSYFWHGILQTIGLIVPILQPAMEPIIPYDFFLDCQEFYQAWASLLEEDRRPTQAWIEKYWDCIWSILIFRLEDRIWVITGYATDWVVYVIGEMPEMYTNISAWLNHFLIQIGEVLPSWASDVAAGLTTLWELIPEPIRDGLQTWSEFLAAAPEAIQEWVREFIGWAIDWINELWEWYTGLGQALTTWWQWAQVQLNEIVSDAYGWIVNALGAAWTFLIWFWNNPTGALASWLSPWWSQLVTFATDCLDFWYNLWGSYADELAAFLADPLDFLWERGELWLNRKLEQS